jgi:ADP-heptose:LPS heptosyltransferase
MQKKILIIRFSSIGDIVLTTPVVRCLRKVQGMMAEVHYVTKEAYAGLLANNPNIDMVHPLDGRGFWNLVARLRAEQFDYIIDLHNNQRSLLLKTLLGKPSSSFQKLNIQKWLLTNLKINRMPAVHIVDRYMQAAASLGVANDGEGLDYFIPEAARIFPVTLPATFRDAYIAVGIGGKHYTKRLPNEKIMAICQKLTTPVVLLGGPEDAVNGKIIMDACHGNVFNACGMFSLDQTAYVLSKASAVITHDTGMMHIAAAFHKKIISIWGNTVPAFGMSPYMPGHPNKSKIIEVQGLGCRPCSKIGYDKCPRGHFDCMQKIDVNEVVRSAISGG